MNDDGSPVYTSEDEFIYYQKMFDDLQDIMELVGFTQEVSWFYNHMVHSQERKMQRHPLVQWFSI